MAGLVEMDRTLTASGGPSINALTRSPAFSLSRGFVSGWSIQIVCPIRRFRNLKEAWS